MADPVPLDGNITIDLNSANISNESHYTMADILCLRKGRKTLNEGADKSGIPTLSPCGRTHSLQGQGRLS